MDKDTALAGIDLAFGSVIRPNTMVRNPNHCDECADHEAVMQAVSPQTVTLKEIGNPGWDPVCYLTDDAFNYFMPGFARLSLSTGENYYLSQFLFHLDQGSRIDAFNREQRSAVARLIDYISRAMGNEIVGNMDSDAVSRVRERLEDMP